MTEQEKLNIHTNALKLIQVKIDSDLSSFKDAITMHCSRVIHSILEEFSKAKINDENKIPQAPDVA